LRNTSYINNISKLNMKNKLARIGFDWMVYPIHEHNLGTSMYNPIRFL